MRTEYYSSFDEACDRADANRGRLSAFEGAEGFKARAAAFRQHHNIAPDVEVPFFLMPTRLDLVKDHAALIASIQEQSEAPFWWCSTPSTAACVDLNQATRT